MPVQMVMNRGVDNVSLRGLLLPFPPAPAPLPAESFSRGVRSVALSSGLVNAGVVTIRLIVGRVVGWRGGGGGVRMMADIV